MRTLLLGMLLAGVTLSPSPRSTGTLIVLNKDEDTASIISLATGKETARIATGPQPNEVSASPDQKIAAITNMGMGPQSPKPGWTMSFVDLATSKVTRTVDLRPHGTAHGMVWLNSNRMLFTSHESDTVNELDVKSGKVVRSIPTGQSGTHLVVAAPNGSRAYAVNAFAGSVSVIDLKAGKVERTIPTGARAEGLSISPDGTVVACGNVAANTVSIIDTKTLKVVRTLEGVGAPIRTMFTSDGKHLVVSSLGSGSLEVFDTSAWSRKQSVKFDDKAAPNGRATPMNLWRTDDDRVYVVLVTSSQVAEVSTDSWKVVRTFATGRTPDGVAVAKA